MILVSDDRREQCDFEKSVGQLPEDYLMVYIKEKYV